MIPNKIKQMRHVKDLSLKAVSEKSGLAYGNLWNIEHGGDVKLSTLYKIAKVLECNVSDLVE